MNSLSSMRGDDTKRNSSQLTKKKLPHKSQLHIFHTKPPKAIKMIKRILSLVFRPFQRKIIYYRKKREIKDLFEIRIPRCIEMFDFLNDIAKTVKAFSTFPSFFVHFVYLFLLCSGWIAFDLVSGFRFLGGPELCTLRKNSVAELKLLAITFYPFIHARSTVRLSFF